MAAIWSAVSAPPAPWFFILAACFAAHMVFTATPLTPQCLTASANGRTGADAMPEIAEMPSTKSEASASTRREASVFNLSVASSEDAAAASDADADADAEADVDADADDADDDDDDDTDKEEEEAVESCNGVAGSPIAPSCGSL